MSKYLEVHSDSMKPYRSARFSNKTTLGDGDWYVEGYLATEWGYATLLIEGGPRRHPVAMADFIFRGQWYRRRWKRAKTEPQFTERTAGLIARNFVKDVVNNRFKKS